MSARDRDAITIIRERIDLAELVAGHGVDLRRAGGDRHVGLCPLHAEKTPSFTVYDDGHFHCFGCLQHGDVFDFVMRARAVDFRSALAELARRAGVSLDASGRRPRLEPTPRQRAAAQREQVFDELRALWRVRAEITHDAVGSPALEAHMMEHELHDVAERELKLIARFHELTIEANSARSVPEPEMTDDFEALVARELAV